MPPYFDAKGAPDPQALKATVQSIMLALSAVRFKAMQLQTKGMACVRWISLRELANKDNNLREKAPSIDERLRTEIEAITDEYVFQDLLKADLRKRY